MYRIVIIILCSLYLASCAVSPDVWQPYPSAYDIGISVEGWNEGEKMPNIKFKNTDGEFKTVKDLRGKVVFVHFWGSWCRPCKKEIPNIQKLYDQTNHSDIEFVLLNLWEVFEDSESWMKEKGYTLPLFDSLSGDSSDKTPLTLSSGDEVNPMKAVPRTFVLDKNGVIIYRRNNSKSNWPSYKVALYDLAMNSVKVPMTTK